MSSLLIVTTFLSPKATSGMAVTFAYKGLCAICHVDFAVHCQKKQFPKFTDIIHFFRVRNNTSNEELLLVALDQNLTLQWRYYSFLPDFNPVIFIYSISCVNLSYNKNSADLPTCLQSRIISCNRWSQLVTRCIFPWSIHRFEYLISSCHICCPKWVTNLQLFSWKLKFICLGKSHRWTIPTLLISKVPSSINHTICLDLPRLAWFAWTHRKLGAKPLINCCRV